MPPDTREVRKNKTALGSPRRSLPDGSFFIGDIDIDPSSPSSPSAAFPDWTFLINGAKSLSRVLGTQGRSTVLAPFLAYGAHRWQSTRDVLASSSTSSSSSSPSPASAGNATETRDDTESAVAPLRRRIAAALPVPTTADTTAAVAATALRTTYDHALDELELALVARQDAATPRGDVLDAMLWLWEVSDSLVPLLKADPAPAQEAVAIFAHFCVLLKHHESHWWLQGWADHLVARAHDLLDAEHRAWIEWPMREIGWAPPSL